MKKSQFSFFCVQHFIFNSHILYFHSSMENRNDRKFGKKKMKKEKKVCSLCYIMPVNWFGLATLLSQSYQTIKSRNVVSVGQNKYTKDKRIGNSFFWQQRECQCQVRWVLIRFNTLGQIEENQQEGVIVWLGSDDLLVRRRWSDVFAINKERRPLGKGASVNNDDVESSNDEKLAYCWAYCSRRRDFLTDTTWQ